jgi:hypothetical protein
MVVIYVDESEAHGAQAQGHWGFTIIYQLIKYHAGRFP